MLYQPMNAFSQSASIIHSARAQLKRVFEVLDELPEIADRPGAIALPNLVGNVVFENVTFNYASGETVLRDINLKIG